MWPVPYLHTRFLLCCILFPISSPHSNDTELKHICEIYSLQTIYCSKVSSSGHGKQKNPKKSFHTVLDLMQTVSNVCLKRGDPISDVSLIAALKNKHYAGTGWSLCVSVWSVVSKPHFSGILHFIMQMTSSKNSHPSKLSNSRCELDPGLPNCQPLEVIISGLYPHRKPLGKKCTCMRTNIPQITVSFFYNLTLGPHGFGTSPRSHNMNWMTFGWLTVQERTQNIYVTQSAVPSSNLFTFSMKYMTAEPLLASKKKLHSET